MMRKPSEICHIDSIPENTARGFSVKSGDCSREIFIVRKKNDFYAYENICPHTGVNLEWQPDHFLDADGEYIQCSTHGARFRINDGLCIYGPCNGQSLVSISLIRDNSILKLQTG